LYAFFIDLYHKTLIFPLVILSILTMIDVKKISQHISDIFQVQIPEKMIVLQTPPSSELGEYALVCFPFAKLVGKAPQEIASCIADALSQDSAYVRVQADNAFVNISLSDTAYIDFIESSQIQQYPSQDKTVVVDYMGPNIGKPPHIGHLCTPNFGQPTINLLRHFGYTVHSDMHQGDWGSIFGKLIAAWKRYGDEQDFQKDPVDHLFRLYVRISAEAEEDESIAQECRDTFRALSE